MGFSNLWNLCKLMNFFNYLCCIHLRASLQVVFLNCEVPPFFFFYFNWIFEIRVLSISVLVLMKNSAECGSGVWDLTFCWFFQNVPFICGIIPRDVTLLECSCFWVLDFGFPLSKIQHTTSSISLLKVFSFLFLLCKFLCRKVHDRKIRVRGCFPWLPHLILSSFSYLPVKQRKG